MILESPIVRLFFELNSFYVSEVNHGSTGLPKKVGDFSLFYVQHQDHKLNEDFSGFQLFANDIAKIKQAQVLVRPYHFQKTTPTLLKNNSKLADLIRKDIARYSEAELFDRSEVAPEFHILILPSLPGVGPVREDIEELLRKNGVGAVISYRSILENLLKAVEFDKVYPKDSPLEMLRILKIYDLIKNPQLELFN
jgi:hypothetical protein